MLIAALIHWLARTHGRRIFQVIRTLDEIRPQLTAPVALEKKPAGRRRIRRRDHRIGARYRSGTRVQVNGSRPLIDATEQLEHSASPRAPGAPAQVRCLAMLRLGFMRLVFRTAILATCTTALLLCVAKLVFCIALALVHPGPVGRIAELDRSPG
jgi:hypothetical protein